MESFFISLKVKKNGIAVLNTASASTAPSSTYVMRVGATRKGGRVSLDTCGVKVAANFINFYHLRNKTSKHHLYKRVL